MRLIHLSALLASVSSGALAQTTSPSPTPTDHAAADAATTATRDAAPPAAQAGIADIVVTAQRREQSAQKAAIAIDVVSGNTLVQAGVTESVQLTKLAPSLSVTNGGGSNTSIYLRGVGNRTSSSYADPAVAVSYDGVFLARAAGAFGTPFFDLARVEVLKGPQGILYGRNATGGAINIIPNRPELNRYGGGFDLSFGNYDTVQTQAYVNVPIGDEAAIRVAASKFYHSPYNRDGTSNQNTSALRAQLLFKPSDDLSVRIGGDYTKLQGAGFGTTYLGNYVPTATGGYTYVPANLGISEGLNTPAANAYRTTLLGAPGFGFLTPLNAQPSQSYTYWGVNAEVNYKTKIGTFTFIPAYRKSTGSSFFYGPSFNTAYADETDKQYSFEGRLAGKVSIFDYIVGGYYFHEDIDNRGEYNQEFVLPIQRYRQTTQSYAAFGQITANVTDRFRLIGGARYTHDHKDMNGLINNFITFCGGLPPANIAPPASFANGFIAPGSTDSTTYQAFPLLNGRGTILKTYDPVIDSGSYSRVTWKGSAEYQLFPRSLLYATVETGYRAGGFQLAEGRPTYKPEFITAYTLGTKNRFFDNRLQLNVEAFYWRYRDQQITYFTVDTSGTLINSTENAGRVSIKGVDADVVVTPTRTTTLSVKAQYLDATYKNLHLYTASPRDNINCPFTLTGQLAGGAPVKDFNCSGRPALYSPKWTINLGIEQRLPLGERLELIGAVNTAWRDDEYGGFEYLDFEKIRPYWKTDINLTLRDKKSSLALSGFVLNAENKRRVTAPQLAPSGQAVALFSAPRTYGFRISADF